jgi:uncharacterized protein YycO
MRTKRRVIGLIALVMAAGAITAGATAVTTSVHPATTNHALTQDTTNIDSVTTSEAAPDFYHDI